MHFYIFVDEATPSPTFKNSENLTPDGVEKEVYNFFHSLLKAQGLPEDFSFGDFKIFLGDCLIDNPPEEVESIVKIEFDDGRKYSLNISEWNNCCCCCNKYVSITLFYKNSRVGSVIIACEKH